MSDITVSEKNKLFTQIKTLLGAPILDVDVENEQMEILLDISIEEYSQFINDWLIQQQWGSLQYLSLDKTEIMFALTTKDLEFEKSFTFAYSKQAGLGTNSKWELKRDYVIISADTQYYTIPAGREVNEVLWVTPTQVGQFSIGGTLGEQGLSFAVTGWNFYGQQMQTILPAFNTVLYAQDLRMKKNILQSQLTYKITAGPNGTKVLHLYPVPGSSDEISGRNGRTYEGRAVWYWYYETESNRDLCLEENSDIIRLPNDIPLKAIKWTKLNESSKVRVRKLLLAKIKRMIGLNRGKFSGKIEGRNKKEVTLDYNMFLAQAEKEEADVYEDLKLFLTKISYEELMKSKANIAEDLNRVMKHTPNTHIYYF